VSAIEGKFIMQLHDLHADTSESQNTYLGDRPCLRSGAEGHICCKEVTITGTNEQRRVS
jgi:hypothetical protein